MLAFVTAIQVRQLKSHIHRASESRTAGITVQFPTHVAVTNGHVMICRNSGSGKSDLIPRARSERPWSNLSSALQPSVSVPMTKTESATTAQLQSIMACMKKSGDQREDGAAPVTESDVERWLSQLSEASGTPLITRNTIMQQTCCISVLSFFAFCCISSCRHCDPI